MPPKKSKQQTTTHVAASASGASSSSGGAAAKDTALYQFLEERDLLLQRPEKALGELRPQAKRAWIIDEKMRAIGVRDVNVSPAIEKAFDEIITNVGDKAQEDRTLTRMWVEIDRTTGRLTVGNNGQGIPVAAPEALHHAKKKTKTEDDNGETEMATEGPKKRRPGKTHPNDLIPSLLFGTFNSSSNYDREGKKTLGGGRYGYGAKATNTYSVEFTVTCSDARRKLRFTRTWRNNMHPTDSDDATVVKVDKEAEPEFSGGCVVSWIPDYARFHMPKGLDADTEAAFRTRVAEMAASMRHGVHVSFNGQDLEHIRRLEDFVPLHAGVAPAPTPALTTASPASADGASAVAAATEGGATSAGGVPIVRGGWGREGEAQIEVIVSRAAKTNPPAPTNVRAWVNGVPCPRGKHVEWLVNGIADTLVARAMRARGGNAEVKQRAAASSASGSAAIDKVLTRAIKDNLFIAMRCTIVNPRFSDLKKDKLLNPVSDWGFGADPKSRPQITESFVSRLDSTLKVLEAAVDKVLSKHDSDASRETNKTDVRSIPKYEPATMASRKRKPGDPVRTLIITEGDSAKSLAVAGLSVVGRELFGVFPVRGKCLNARDHDLASILKRNEELRAIAAILGLERGVRDIEQLPYQKVAIMADQDADGAHIVMLLVTFFVSCYPWLFASDPLFVQRFATPVIRVPATAAATRRGVPDEEFFSVGAFEAWERARQQQPSNNDYGKAKYYKGLATSDHRDAKRYFGNLERYLIDIEVTGACEELLDMAMRKKRADDRKAWLSSPYDPATAVDYGLEKVSLSDYIVREFRHHPEENNRRVIPDAIDGLKPGQRKIAEVALQRWKGDLGKDQEEKVADFAGYVSAQARYHHGEAALQNTIVCMARDFDNNINLLMPRGMFGTRGTHAAGQARYIQTQLEPIAPFLFPAVDNALLVRQVDEGREIEPKRFVPVIPFALINGASGIGTGWSTEVPCYDPEAVSKRVRALVAASRGSAESGGGQFLPATLAAHPDGPLRPWFHLFKRGEIVTTETGFTMWGCAERVGPGRVRVTELPPGVETDKWRDDLKSKTLPAGVVDPSLAEKARAASKKRKAKDAEEAKSKKKKTTASKKKKAGASDDGDDDQQDGEQEGAATAAENAAKKAESAAVAAAAAERPLLTRDPESGAVPETEVDVVLPVDDAVLNTMIAAYRSKNAGESDNKLLLRALGLVTSGSTNNMWLWHQDRLRRFGSPEELILAHFDERLAMYGRRHAMLCERLERQIPELDAIARFVSMVCEGQIELKSRTTESLCKQFAELGFPSRQNHQQQRAEDENQDDEQAVPAAAAYRYLLDIRARQFTVENVRRCLAEREAKLAELDALKKKTPQDLWIQDLDALDAAYRDFCRRRDDAHAAPPEEIGSRKKGGATKKATATRKTTTTASSSSSGKGGAAKGRRS